VLNEIEEFYSYVEMPQAAENLKAWEGSFPGGMWGSFASFVIKLKRFFRGKTGLRARYKSAKLTWSFSSKV
jgi:hypothetical protein